MRGIVLGGMAITAVVATACSTPPPPPAVTVTSTIAASDVEQQRLNRRAAELDQRERDLDIRESAVATAEAEAAANSFSGEGTFIVGQEIAPGTWRSEGSTRPPASCYWARLRSFAGGDDIIDNENSDGPTIVTIQPTDVAFKTERCGTWTRIG